MVGLTITMYFRQFEDLKFQNFPEEHAPGSPKALCHRHLHSLSFQNAPPNEKSWLRAFNRTQFFQQSSTGFQCIVLDLVVIRSNAKLVLHPEI